MMRRTVTAVNGRRIELSNLQKLLFPGDSIIKAQLIEYYFKVAPTLLRHIKDRPLSFVRYPDGIEGEAFFQKNRPAGSPKWMRHVEVGDQNEIDYILAADEASVVWMANAACVEIHQSHCRTPQLQKPDYLVLDLDPPPSMSFADVVDTAFKLKKHLESLGYVPFVKTTGKKGLHIVSPIERRWTFDKVFEATSTLAQRFVQKNRPYSTLHLKKEARKEKILIDIYRNRPTQTIISPYSLRGQPRAPVSMPLSWEDLRSLKDPAAFNLHTVPKYLLTEGDAWETIGAYTTKLHTVRKSGGSRLSPARTTPPKSLEAYSEKRQFAQTPEPAPSVASDQGNAFVIHRHHASHLHYDLRLEHEGVLRSWAVPKGLPPRRGIKRFAVEVEDHPLSYLTFEGRIPKGEYGAGRVWVFALGEHAISKKKKDGFYFRLNSPQLTAEFRFIHTRDKEWLLERLDPLQRDWLRDPVEPMLAQIRDEPFDSPDYLYEVKWDGIRAMIALDEGDLTIRSRSGRDITRRFPELLIPNEAFRASCALFDAEIVCLDADGKPRFEQTIRRLQQTKAASISRASTKHPVVCYVFDCLYLDGRSLLNDPLIRRREWMSDAMRPNSIYRVSEAVSKGVPLFQAASDIGLEGIMAKRCDGIYLPGKRSSVWLKIKSRRTQDCIILGYTAGKGNRQPYFGALHLGWFEDNKIQYVGRVGTGFDDGLLKSVMRILKTTKRAKKPMRRGSVEDGESVWLEPNWVCEVCYASITGRRTLREPVFVRLRPDLRPQDCQVEA